jgi:predicted CxxxxCH...CXXCH cytochrome family protein
MERDFKVGCKTKPRILWFVSLITALFMGGVAHAAPQYSLTCSSCHGMPPIDSTSRDPNTGAFNGNHQTHLSSGAPSVTCNVCHNMTNYSNSHQDGQISLKNGINGSPKAGALYSGITTFKNQTSVPVLGSCANVNCHFESGTPSWGATTLLSYTNATTNDCNDCHGMPPAGTSGTSYAGGADGSHTKHNEYYAGADKCIKCHADHTAEANKFAHATSAGNRVLNIALRDAANVASGSYNGTLTTINYLPSQTKTTFGSCSNLYCHSSGIKGSAPFTGKANAQWAAGVLSCDKCHGYDSSSLPAYNMISSGRHKQHIANGTLTGVVINCETCHAATVSGGAITAGTRANHVDKNVNVKFQSALNAGTPLYNGADALTPAAGSVKAAGSAPANCANLYCHSNGNKKASGTPVYQTVAWGTGTTLDCTGCHGSNGTSSSPVYANSGVGTNQANNHVIHVQGKGMTCNLCHLSTTANGTTLIAGGQHLNGSIQVSFDTSFYTSIGTAGYASNTCNNTYCHSNGNGTVVTQPQWGAQLDCRGCHGGDAAHANVINTNKHRIHIDPSAAGSVLGLGTGLQCAACHVKTINTFANNTTITAQAYHVNKLKDYSGARAGRIVAAGQCANTYCHSSGAKTPKFRNMTGSKLWTGSATLDCKGCHGYEKTTQGAAFNSIAGEPNYAGANSHGTHVNTGANSTSCAKCHDHTVSSTVVGKFKDYTAHHIDGNRDVTFSAAVGGTWTGTTCNNTACHGGGNPQWGVTVIACDSCHGAAFRSFSSASKKGAHKQHYESETFSAFNDAAANLSSTTQYRFTCAACHSTPAQHSNLANSRSSVGKAEVYFGLYSANSVTTGRKWYNYNSTVAGQDNSAAFAWTNGGGTSCNTTYCHSDGKGGAGLIAPTWGMAEGALTTAVGCAGCHANETSSGSLSGAHLQHVANTRTGFTGVVSFGCVDCHAKTVSAKPARAITDKTKHVNNFHDYSGVRAGGSVRYSGGNCSNVYCHSNGKGVYGSSIAWTSGAGALNCTASCHTVSSNPHAKHLSFSSITCDKCHTNTVAAGSTTALKSATTTHINGTYNVNGTDVKFATMSSSWKASFTANTCNNVMCHSNGKGTYQPIAWSAGTLNCSSCHPNLGGAHLRHIGGSYATTLLAQQNLPFQPLSNYTSNLSAGTDPLSGTAWANYRFGCASCHPYGTASHMNGSIDVILSSDAAAGTMRSKNPTSTYTPTIGGAVGTNSVTCANIYCHSNGSTAYTTSSAWSATYGADRCNRCHGNAPATGAHAAHAIGIHSDDIFNGTSGKLSNLSSSVRSSAHGNATQATTISCNICHFVTTEFARNKYNTKCSSCHSDDAKEAGRIYATDTNTRGLKMHVNGKLDMAFNPISVRSKAQLRTSAFADYTAAGGYWNRNGSNYKNGAAAYDIAKSALDTTTMWNGGTKTCSNVACHMAKPVTWNAGSLTCEACHSKL